MRALIHGSLNGVVFRTTRRRLSRQSQNAAHCLMSDSDSSRDGQLPTVRSSEVDVDDCYPANVDLMSCNSSFSDCSLQCHELVTYSGGCEPLPEGVVKVSVRPPQCAEPCVACGPCGPCLCVPCTDRDRYDIKFVSHLVERKSCAKVRRVSPPPPPPVEIPPPPPPVTPSVSEETISVPTIISIPPPSEEVIEEVPPSPTPSSQPSPPPPSPVVSTPRIVTPGIIGVTGTQVVTRSRKHYGDLCKLIRCSKPRPPRHPVPCEVPPCSPCDCCPPYEPCEYSLTPPYDGANQSNSCSSCPPPSEPCCPSAAPLYDEDPACDPCCPPCEPCPTPCCKPPPPLCCPPCCKVTWLRSITTKPTRFTQELIMKGVGIEERYCVCEEPNVVATSQVSFAREMTVFSGDQRSSSSTMSQSRSNVNVNAMASQGCNPADVSSSTTVTPMNRRCSAPPEPTPTPTTTPTPTPPQTASMYLQNPASCVVVDVNPCRPCADPWKRPADMDEQTFNRYVEQIVSALSPVIPLNPFDRQRDASRNTEPPNCDRIRGELERLLAAVDQCDDSTPCCQP